jgi:hypothetical protein
MPDQSDKKPKYRPEPELESALHWVWRSVRCTVSSPSASH